MITTLDQFYEEAARHVPAFDAFASRHALAGSARADHICWKCESHESFESLRALLEPASEYLYQSSISKRRIAVIRLQTLIATSLGAISFLELSDQKPDGSQKDGFDHIEVYPTVGTYESMVTKLALTEKITEVKRPHHTTHDITISTNFLFRCTRGPLIEKIKKTEMM